MGFEPRKEVMDYDVEKTTVSPVEIDSVKLYYLKKFVLACKTHRIPFVMFVSPRYDVASTTVHEPVKTFCVENEVPFYDYFTHTYYKSHKGLFADSKHLNEEGAYYYTKQIVKNLTQVNSTHD